MKKTILIIMIILLGVSLFGANSKNSQSMTNGIYMDSNKNYHPWNIQANHAITWDDRDFMPCGFKVCFKSLEDTNTSSLYQEDINIINQLAASGIDSVLISNNNQFTISNPEMLNQIIELLESHNMTYGIDLSEESSVPLKGYLINPIKYKINGPYPETTIVRMWEEVDSGIYAVVSKITGEIIDKGAIAKNNNGQIIIKLRKALSSNETLIVYPRVTYYSNFDLWQGYNEIRDNTLNYFKQVKLGKGFRFFYNPFNLDKLCKIADQNDFIPTSSGFNIAFENYLTKNYFHGPSLANSWSIIDKTGEKLDEISDFLKLFPMWNNQSGVNYMYSLVTGNYLETDTTYSTYWLDMSLLKFSSIQNYMSSISMSIRDNIANVPILFSSSIATQTFTIPYDKGTCDGFAYNFRGLDIHDTNSMSLLFSYSESNPKTTSLFGVSDKNSLTKEDIEFLAYSGYRGFYLNYNPAAINSIKTLRDEMTGFTPEGIPFPAILPINAQTIDQELLWYPSNDTYITEKYGDNIFAYQKDKSTEATFFTLKGKQTITIVGKDDDDCKIIFPKNKKIKKGKKAMGSKEWTFEIDETPTIVSNVDLKKTCPKQAVETLMDKYESFIKEAELETTTKELMEKNLKDIKEVYKNSSYKNAYGMISEKMNKFMILTGADIWMEAEKFPRHSFSRREIMKGASENAVLLLDTDEDPKLGAYYVTATIDAPYNRSYVMWIAASKPEISCPFQISSDNNPFQDIKTDEYIPYTDDLVWYKAGILNLSAGTHTIDIKISGTNKNSLKYYLALDAILLTGSDYTPKGTEKPKLVLNL
ncbi:MAG: hypothetical protein KBT47_04070 [Armatimonadetes bacterium]|nr:hypothetical protein [Candidatus Hippobium faecium]